MQKNEVEILGGRVYHRVAVLRMWGNVLRAFGYVGMVGALSTIPCALIVAAAPSAMGATSEAFVIAGLGVGGVMLGILLVLSTIGPAITLVVIANLLLGFADHLELQYLIYERSQS